MKLIDIYAFSHRASMINTFDQIMKDHNINGLIDIVFAQGIELFNEDYDNVCHIYDVFYNIIVNKIKGYLFNDKLSVDNIDLCFKRAVDLICNVVDNYDPYADKNHIVSNFHQERIRMYSFIDKEE